jgi:hypothetical protein
MEIIVLKEEARGCGYRHSGKDGVGIYLMGDGIFEVCERLPFPVGTCPCCGQGTKFSRGFTWITPTKLFAPALEPRCALVGRPGYASSFTGRHNHMTCLMCTPPLKRHGLMWVGEKFYTTGSFLQEAVTRGISKRIATFPKGFKVGETMVYLAHKKAIPTEKDSQPAVFTVFEPNRLELVVDTTNPDDLPKRALSIAEKLGDKVRIVKIEPIYQQQSLPKEAE